MALKTFLSNDISLLYPLADTHLLAQINEFFLDC